jgi:cation diffusion facilitator family transporter
MVAAMLIASAVLIAVQAVGEIRAPHQTPAPYTLAVLFAVVLIKEGLYRYEIRTGRIIGSTAVEVDAWHHRGDAMTSLAAGLGITIALLGGRGYESADDWAALAACGIIVFNGGRFAHTAVRELMDTTPDTGLAADIVGTVRAVRGALGVEKVLIRKMGPMLFVDLHLEVDARMPVRDAHSIAHEVKDTIRSRWPQIADVLVHVEPYEPRSPKARSSASAVSFDGRKKP